jgi:hypothetical protein
MDNQNSSTCTAFAGTNRIASGSRADVALAAFDAQTSDHRGTLLVFDDQTSRLVEFDLRGTRKDVAARYAEPARGVAAAKKGASSTTRGRGRPKLGVVSREVTLLPRHWAWLSVQRGGASATLRRLVDEARRQSGGLDDVRRSQDTAFRFMNAMAGDHPGFEEATRALYAGDPTRFDAETDGWPSDVRDYARQLATGAFAKRSSPPETAKQGSRA